MTLALRALTLAFAGALFLLSPAASRADGLQSNNDMVCLLVAVVLFLPAVVLAIFATTTVRLALAVGAFAGAWLIQLWWLTWIEGYPWRELLTSHANAPLWVWAAVYALSLPTLAVATVVLSCRQGVRKLRGA